MRVSRPRYTLVSTSISEPSLLYLYATKLENTAVCPALTQSLTDLSSLPPCRLEPLAQQREARTRCLPVPSGWVPGCTCGGSEQSARVHVDTLRSAWQPQQTLIYHHPCKLMRLESYLGCHRQYTVSKCVMSVDRFYSLYSILRFRIS